MKRLASNHMWQVLKLALLPVAFMSAIMGATAFIMAINLDVPYRDIVVVTVIPSVLYFSRFLCK